jgi:hypothetical protein
VWSAYRTLGSALSLTPCSNGSLNITNGNGHASLSCPGKFSTGTATFDMTLVTSDWGKTWQISALALGL